MDELKMRDYKAGDEAHILALFVKAFLKPLEERFWRWRYLNDPYGPGIIRLMFNKEELVGHYAVIPLPLQVAYQNVNAAFSMTTMIHPSYQERGIFTKLASDVYERCKREGIRVVFGFPNQNSWHGFTNKLGWLGFGPICYLESSNNIEPLRTHPDYICHMIDFFSDDTDIFWESVKNRYSIIVPRESSFLNWRYVEKPGKDYEIFIVRGKRDTMLGYIVLKVFCDGERRVGHIIDILATDDPHAVLSLLETAHAFFCELSVDVINSWIPPSSDIYDTLKKRGYFVKTWNTYFGTKVLNAEDNLTQIVRKASNWWFTMGDSDVF